MKLETRSQNQFPAALAQGCDDPALHYLNAHFPLTGIPVILCDEWSEAQVKAFRLMVNRSVTWAAWDEELLALELQELNAADFDLDLTGFNPKELDDLLALPDEEKLNTRHSCGALAIAVFLSSALIWNARPRTERAVLWK